MANLTIIRTVQAPRPSVWAVLADYPDIADWNDGVVSSHAIGAATSGVGARRKCELDGSVSMRETVTEWVSDEKLAVAIDQIEKMPIADAAMAFTLNGDGPQTEVTMSYDYTPKGGPLGFIISAMMARPMRKGFNGFVDQLEREARARSVD